MHKALILDRDGVINKERGEYTFRIEDLELLEGTLLLAQKAKSRAWKLIVISNQSGIAKGLYSLNEVHAIEEKIRSYYASAGIRFDAFYYCPHHPDFGNCLCRKPKSLLFEKAIARFELDVSESLMIGDKERDVHPAQELGMKTLLVEANSDLSGVEL